MPLDVPTNEELLLRNAATDAQAADNPASDARPSGPVTAPGEAVLPGNISAPEGIGPAVPLDNGDDAFTLVPAMDELGRVLSRQQAAERYAVTGENYGLFETEQRAREFQEQHTSPDAREKMRAALLLSRGISPDEIARDKAMAKRLGIPFGAVRYNRAGAQDETDARQIEQYEGLVDYASRSEAHAAIVRGDAGPLSHVAMEVAAYDAANTPAAIRARNRQAIEQAGISGEVRATRPFLSTEGQSEAWRKGDVQRRMAALGNRWAAGEDIEAEEKALAEEQALLEQQGKVATTALLDKLPGLNAAIEQGPTNIPIMLKSTTAALMAATGAFLLGGAETAATGGLAAPAVPPQVWAAARAAYLGITAKETYNVERGAEIMAMRQLRDADGNPLPRDVILAASSIYATLSAATEVGGEAVFLSMLRPLGIGAGAAKPAIKGAVERAAKDKSLWKALLDVGARIGITAGAEGVTEGAQEGQAILAESAAGAAANARGAKFDTSILTPENAKRVQESVEAGIAGGFWQGGGPVIVSGVMQGMSARAARKFADDQNRLHASIERTKTRQRDPEAMGEILEALSPVMQEEVTLPMDAAVELHQQGMDILTPLGISRESAEKAAALGQSVSVKLGSLHTMLDARQFQAAAEIMRRDDAAASAAEYGEADATMDKMLRQALEDGAAAEDVRNGTATLTPEQKAELENVHQDFRSQMAEAIKSVPGLANQVQIQAGMEPYVDALLNLWRRRAVVAARRTGENPADIYRRTALHGAQLLKKQLRRATPEQQIEDDLAAPAETPAAPVISTPEAAAAQPLAPEAPAMQTPEQEEAAAAPAVPVRQAKGADTALVTSTGDTPARFEVWELADLIPSHDPSAQFARRADYPADVQERPYHSDPGEQDKVRRNAAALDPRYLVNTNPDAMSGPPVITADGVVLGGNSRTMSVQMAYGSYPERAQGYKDALAKQAAAFGLDPAQVVAMQQPVLVRVVQTPMTRLEMAQASRRYNEVTTQALQAEAEGVSKSKLLTAETMAALAERMQEYGTLREFFDAAASREFVQRLMDDGVIERTQASRLTESDGRLNAEGKTLAENALRGVIVQDYDVIRNAPDSALNKIDRAIPYLAQLKARGEGWDMSGVVTEALRILGTAKNENQDVAVFLGQGSLLQSREAVRPAVQAMALTLDRATQKEVALRFACMAHDAQQRNKGQGLLGVAEDANTPAKSFINAFLRTVAAVGGVPVTEYNPARNARHAAIAYAWKNGGRGHTVAEALNRIVKAVTDKKAAKEVREQAREIQGQLAGMDGSVIVQEPKLGSFFSYKPGQTLFQFIGQQGAAALDAAEEVALRMDNLAVARDMESAGKDAKAILYATGWQRGADMKWRYELDDSGIRFSKSADMLRVGQNKEYARYKELADNINNLSEQGWQEYSNLDDTWGELERRDQNNFMEHGAKLEEVIEAPELFKAYPELRDVHVIFMRPSTMEGYLGLWNRVGKTIKLNKKLLDSAVGQENKIKKVLLHEIQHAIQENEGFERGGNAALFEHVVSEFNDEIKFLRNNLAQLEKWSGIKDFVSESMRAVVAGEKKFADHWRDLDEFKKTNPDYLDNVDAIKRVEKEISDAIDVFKAEHGNAMTADEMYRHLMGEVEARNTEARMNMSAAERLASLATETEDVAREDQIILREGLEAGAAMSAEGTNAFGVPLSRVTRIEGDVTPADVEAALLELAGRDLPNDIEGITAQVNGNQRRKLNSQPAAKKSMENGFTRSEHRGIAAKIAEAWRWAAEAQRGGDAKSGKPDLTIRRFVSALNVNGRDVFAWITVKDSDKGARIYSVELMQNEKLRDKVGGGAGKMPTADALHRSFDEIIKRLNAPVNGAMPGQRDSLRSGSPAGARGSVTRRGGN
ncbi:MAG: hypothetical protein E7022_02975 [Desulfovibrio desulfuricans]|nr:hypothetical protein [Desulfovibrio desulfuricans]